MDHALVVPVQDRPMPVGFAKDCRVSAGYMWLAYSRGPVGKITMRDAAMGVFHYTICLPMFLMQ